MRWAFLSHLSIYVSNFLSKRRSSGEEKLTEVSNKRRTDSVRRPFTISDISIRSNIDTEILVSLLQQ